MRADRVADIVRITKKEHIATGAEPPARPHAGMVLLQVWGYRCERCGHLWVPRSADSESPRVCPKCKSPYWDTPRKQRAAS